MLCFDHKLVDYIWCYISGMSRSTYFLAKWMSMAILGTVFQSKPQTCINVAIILCHIYKFVDYFWCYKSGTERSTNLLAKWVGFQCFLSLCWVFFYYKYQLTKGLVSLEVAVYFFYKIYEK